MHQALRVSALLGILLIGCATADSVPECQPDRRRWELIDANRTALVVIDVQQNFSTSSRSIRERAWSSASPT